MDFFTHILLSAILGISISGKDYLIFSIIAGILPDFDVFFFPFAKKSKYFAHHGFSHSILFVFISSIILSIIFYFYSNLNLLNLLIICLVCGFLHIFLDSLTNWSCPLLLPFSKKEFKYDIDRAVNFYLIPISIFLILFIYYSSYGLIDKIIYIPNVAILLGQIIFIIFTLYLFLRFLMKLQLEKKFSMSAMPTASIFQWYLVKNKRERNEIEISYAFYNFGKISDEKFSKFKIEKVQLPIDSEEKAKSYTFNLKEVDDFLSRFKYQIVSVEEKDENWEIFWYPAEMILSRNKNALGIFIVLKKDGSYRAKREFRKI